SDAIIEIDRGSGEPVYEQIARQVRAAIAEGTLQPGTDLPSVRTLASDLGVNLNTVARAYRALEEDGFVAIRHRTGAALAAPSRRPDRDAGDRFRADLRAVLERLKQAGFARDEMRRFVVREIDALHGRR